MSKWHALWKTVRPLNLLIMALTMIGVYGAIVNQLEGLDSNHVLFGILCLSIVLLGAGGNVINDIEDVEVDAINKPGENQVGLTMSKGWAMNWYFILTLSGLLLGLIVSTIQEDLLLFLIILFIAVSLWFYTRWMQKQVLIGNFVVAVLCSILPLISMLYVFLAKANHHQNLESNFMNNLSKGFSELGTELIALPYFFLAFSLTLARELAKDIQDINGDESTGYRTFAVTYGFKKAKTILIFLLSLILILKLIFLIFIIFDMKEVGIFLVLLAFVLFPISFTVVSAIRMRTSSDAASTSKWLKISMALGIATTAFFWFL